MDVYSGHRGHDIAREVDVKFLRHLRGLQSQTDEHLKLLGLPIVDSGALKAISRAISDDCGRKAGSVRSGNRKKMADSSDSTVSSNSSDSDKTDSTTGISDESDRWASADSSAYSAQPSKKVRGKKLKSG